MYLNKIIAVVIPAYNEEKLIGRVIETMPRFVDQMVIVDDNSTDATCDVVDRYRQQDQDGRIVCLRHNRNRGNGAARLTGIRHVLNGHVDIIGFMDGDAQMDPDELEKLIDPICRDEVDMAKGNRLFSGEAWNIIPTPRYLGNSILSMLTKIASGYWHIADSQSGYIALSAALVRQLPIDRLYTDYGFPNDLLIFVNIQNGRVRDIPIRPIYNIGERSDMRVWRVIPRISWLLLRRFFERMKDKYIIRDFHPLVFFYLMSFLLILLSIPLCGRLLFYWWQTGIIPRMNALALFFSLIMGFQMLFFAMWFDMDNNKNLR